ncbi:acyl- thioesterase ii [Fusarium austroafricanum]|uniref:Acyl- thioesterase ii n=1 Tax=Fusarium austroafricanum TaxID=2364996 RepID=A0A8H4KFM6_9HYPO|nr:acyl- thioesterase ii [Fusarium austroafricanum]
MTLSKTTFTIKPSASLKMADRNLGQAQADLVTPEAVIQMLRHPWPLVYKFSPDGEKYISPQCLNGTPATKITETGEYWKPGWFSLDSYLAQEQAEEDKKKESKEKLRLDRNNKTLAAEYKLHMDNVSKHRKIREIFGPGSPYHPNQIVSKHHLPERGLCQQELMYKLGCKISDLKVLQDKKELAMDPFDFLRWRVTRKMQSMFDKSAQSGRDVIKRIINSICDDSGPNGSTRNYEDPLLRAAIIRSARYQNRSASFNLPGEQGKKSTKSKSITAGKGSIGQTRSRDEPISSALARQTTSSRIEKRPRPAPTSTYQGVNAWRAQQSRNAQDENTRS